MRVVDLFEGAGGFTKGASVFTSDIVGYELDDDARATSRAAGFRVVQANLANVDPWDIERPDGHLHLHASPPCTTFSAAGRGHGRKFVDDLCVAVRDLLAGDDWHDVIAGLPDDIDDTSKLVLVPARWIAVMEPDTISMEQVRAVLPIWDAYAEALELIDGYSAWTALLSAEQYGLPQTRIRAWLGASRDLLVEPPTPTHSKYHNRNPTKLDDGVLPWVSMADALGWVDAEQAGFLRRADSDDAVEVDGVKYRARDLIDATERPALALTEKARSMQVYTHWRASDEERATTRHLAEPAGTVKFGHATDDMRFTDDEQDWGYEAANREGVGFTHYAPAGVGQKNHPANPRPLGGAPAPTVTSQAKHYFYDADDFVDGEQLVKHQDETMDEADWTRRRPATTVCADPRLSGPGRNDPDVPGSQYGKNARKITVEEAAILQGFPADYPFQGTKTSRFRQVGNAVPPVVAEVVVRSLIDGRTP